VTILTRWLRLAPAERRLAAEAALLLMLAWGAVRLLPFRWYAPLLGRQVPPPGDADEHREHGEPASSDAAAHDVARALGRASGRLPWHSTCLMRVAAGKVMLRRRNRPGTVYLGVAGDPSSGPGFHAWLRSGAVWVSGAREAPGHTVLSAFR
jgi:hypothetical protein